MRQLIGRCNNTVEFLQLGGVVAPKFCRKLARDVSIYGHAGHCAIFVLQRAVGFVHDNA